MIDEAGGTDRGDLGKGRRVDVRGAPKEMVAVDYGKLSGAVALDGATAAERSGRGALLFICMGEVAVAVLVLMVHGGLKLFLGMTHRVRAVAADAQRLAVH